MNAPDKIYINGWSAFATEPVKDGTEYIRKDALLEWAKEHQEGERKGSYTWACYQIIIDKLEAIDMAIDAHSQPSLPSDVDDAAVEYAYNVDVTGNGGEDYIDDVRIAFKAGAEWQRGRQEQKQRIKETALLKNLEHDIESLRKDLKDPAMKQRCRYEGIVEGYESAKKLIEIHIDLNKIRKI